MFRRKFIGLGPALIMGLETEDELPRREEEEKELGKLENEILADDELLEVYVRYRDQMNAIPRINPGEPVTLGYFEKLLVGGIRRTNIEKEMINEIREIEERRQIVSNSTESLSTGSKEKESP